MGRPTERGQVIVEMIVISALIGALFIFILDRGALAKSEISQTRFQSPKQNKLQFYNFDPLDQVAFKSKNNHRNHQ